MAPSAPLPRHHPHRLALDRGTFGSGAPPAPPGSSGSGFSGLTGSDPAGNPPGNRSPTVASHQSCFLWVSVDVVHVVFFVRNCATSILRISQLLLDPSINLLRNIRTFWEHVTFVTIQHSDTTRRRVFSNRQQWFTNKRLNTSNSEIGSPIVATSTCIRLPPFDKFSSCCAESEIIVTRNRLPVRDTLRPCRISSTCVDSNIDPFRPLLLKCVNVKKTHAESTDFDFWFNI